MLQLYGIRHHGPGSARAVLNALEDHPPECLLIEAPFDAEGLLKFLPKHSAEDKAAITGEAMRDDIQSPVPPVSALIYNPKDLTQASYLPFAIFSPEWQAIRFAIDRDIPVRFIDLPMSVQFALDELDRKNQQREIDFFRRLSPEDRSFRKDPMAHLAKLAGYADSERWWEVTFESADNGEEIFAAIREMVTSLRQHAGESPRTLQREAFMRQSIRKIQKEGFERIAIVCGAWHVPALADPSAFKKSHDAALLRGIKKVKTAATWIPWSYDRMTFHSGYRAGMISPAWYELLFLEKEEAATRWMVQVANLLRSEDLDASSAHVIEAIRLTETLAALRQLAVPGIDELKEAAVTTICGGDPELLTLIEEKLITGKRVGSVPDTIPVVPLQRDILQEVKSARLKKYWEDPEEQWLGATAARPQGGIDLREDSGKKKSRLLHRLNLLNIPWGRPVEIGRHQSAGGFTEFWKMRWAPEFAITIIEMGAWGNTVEEACLHYLRKRTAQTTALPALTDLVQHTLHADLPAAFDALLLKLENLAALTTDVYHLMDALPPLVQIIRYGNTRDTDVGAVEKVVAHLIPRICIGLRSAVVNLDSDASGDAQRKIQQVNHSLGQLNDPSFNRQWYDALGWISGNEHVNGLITGFCSRILFDKKIITEETISIRMRYKLSRAVPPLAAAEWLEGFLQGSGLLLLHNHSLWNLLDHWVVDLNEEHFNEVLPLLRRTFSSFSQPERERMMNRAKNGQLATHSGEAGAFEKERAKMVQPVVRALLGIQEK